MTGKGTWLLAALTVGVGIAICFAGIRRRYRRIHQQKYRQQRIWYRTPPAGLRLPGTNDAS